MNEQRPSNQPGELVRLLRQRYEDEGDTISRKAADEIERLTKIAEVASNVSLMLQADEADGSEGMDIAEWCEAVDELRKVLRPWREARLADVAPAQGVILDSEPLRISSVVRERIRLFHDVKAELAPLAVY